MASFKSAVSDFSINLLTSRPMSWLMQPLRNQVVPVFMLHRMEDASRGVRGHTAQSLEQALAYLKARRYNVVSVRDLMSALAGELTLPKRSVAFTMDDGFYDQATLALPLFEQYQMPVTLFLATDMLDHQRWSWDYQIEYLIRSATAPTLLLRLESGTQTLNVDSKESKRTAIRAARLALKNIPLEAVSQVMEDLSVQIGMDVPMYAPPPYQPMSWSQAKRLESAYVEFGPHSRQHLILSQLTDAEAEEEIQQSWASVCEQLSRPVPVFCFPNGRFGKDFTARDQALVKKAGLKGAFSADPGYVNLGPAGASDQYALKRFAFPDRFADFKQYCSWLEKGKELIFSRSGG